MLNSKQNSQANIMIKLNRIMIISLMIFTQPLMAEDISCVIEPRQIIKLSTSVEGVVDMINVERGQIVNKGQVIASLESAVEESSVTLSRERAANNATILSAREQIKMLEHKLARIKKMHTRKHSSDADLEEISTELSLAHHQLSEAQHQKKIAALELAYTENVLQQRVIHSPIDGIVIERMMSPGEYRNEQSHVVTLAEIDPLNVEMFVPLKFHGILKINDVVTITPEAPFDKPYLATVTIIDKVFDAASATFGVRMSLSNPGYVLPAGIKCSAQVGN